MTLPYLPTVLWQSVPFGDRDAFQDWHVQHFLVHQALAAKTKTPLIPLDSMREDPFPHSVLHSTLAAALRLPVTFDFADTDLNDRDAYYQFMLAHAQHHNELAAGAGL